MCYTYKVKIEIENNALKHGLDEEQIRFVFANPAPGFEGRIRWRDKRKTPPRYSLIGSEPYGGELIELIYVYTTEGVSIFHANYLTKQFLKDMKEVKQ